MIDLGFFLDSYYTYDFNQPNGERAYTTQPVQHNRPEVNLVHGDIQQQNKSFRSRLALQAGDSVERNAKTEPGAEKYIQEAYAGLNLGSKTWIDGGIFLGNIGSESWISKDNWTYTRALNLDYVPYYSAGLRLQHELSAQQSFQLQLINGWQNVSENNSAKAIGMQYKELLTDKVIFTYNNFFGDEQVVSQKPRFRAYHNFILEMKKSETWQTLFAFDIGHQSQQNNNGVDAWYTGTATIRHILSETKSLALRLEYYNDRHQANIISKTDNGFQVSGASVNFDQKIANNALWRSEVRGFYSLDQIYPTQGIEKKSFDSFFVTSIAVWF
jgi:hypothetical protein